MTSQTLPRQLRYAFNLASYEFHYIHKHKEAEEDAVQNYDHLPPDGGSHLLGQEAMLHDQDVDPCEHEDECCHICPNDQQDHWPCQVNGYASPDGKDDEYAVIQEGEGEKVHYIYYKALIYIM